MTGDRAWAAMERLERACAPIWRWYDRGMGTRTPRPILARYRATKTPRS